MGGPSHRGGPFRRDGQRAISARRRHGRATATYSGGRQASGQGAAVAAEICPSPAARHPRPARERDTRRGLPLPLVRLPVARGRERDYRAHRRFAPGGDGTGAVRSRPAAYRSHGRAVPRTAQFLPRRAVGNARLSHPRRDLLPARHARYRHGDGGLGSGPSGARMGPRACLVPRRPATREPAGRTGPAKRRHRLRVSGCGRSRMRLDRRVEPVFRRKPERVPRGAGGR